MSTEGPDPDRVVERAHEAAEDVVFSRLDHGQVEDFDVTVSYADGVLEVDVYLRAPEANEDRIADDAALAARGAVDELF